MSDPSTARAYRALNAQLWPLIEAAGKDATRVGVPARTWAELQSLRPHKDRSLEPYFYAPWGRVELFPLDGAPATLSHPVDADGRPVEGA
jgi:hypothetical protein